MNRDVGRRLQVDRLVGGESREVGERGEGVGEAQGREECERSSEAGRERFRASAVDERNGEEHHSEPTERHDLEWRSALVDRRYDEEHDRGEAGDQPDQRTEPMEASGRDRYQSEGEGEPEQRRAALEVDELVGVMRWPMRRAPGGSGFR